MNYERLSSNKEVWHAMVSEGPLSPNSAEQPSDPRKPMFPSLVRVGASGQTLNLTCSFLHGCGCSPAVVIIPWAEAAVSESFNSAGCICEKIGACNRI